MNREFPFVSEAAERIGEKLKRLRISRGLTQRELSEGIVSRNMLSMIESGNALPSIETLLMISDVLSIPAGYFFADEAEEKMYSKRDVITTVYQLMSEKRFADAIDICEPYANSDGEMCLCAAICHLYTGVEYLDKFMVASAQVHITKALGFAEMVPSYGKNIIEICEFIMFLAENVSKDSIPDNYFNTIDFDKSSIPASYIVYLKAYKALKDGDPECASAIARSGLLSGFRALHIRGAVLMATGDYNGATRVFDLALSSDDGGFYSKYKLLCDLEFCRKNAGDFEAAYELSTSRMEMIGMFGN